MRGRRTPWEKKKEERRKNKEERGKRKEIKKGQGFASSVGEFIQNTQLSLDRLRPACFHAERRSWLEVRGCVDYY